MSRSGLINNLDNDRKILKTETATNVKYGLWDKRMKKELFEHQLLVKSMHKKVIKGTDSGCLDNQYR